jgi:hypothetical protein
MPIRQQAGLRSIETINRIMKIQTKTEATPRPYIVTETYGTGHYIRGTVPVIRFGDCIDAVIVSLGAPKAECEAKAVRIVKAVNEYDAVCAVVEAAKEEHGGGRHEPECPICAALAQLEAIRKEGKP